MWRKIRANFFAGLLITIPLFVTFWVLYFIINKLNLLLLEPIMNILVRWLPGQNVETLTKMLIFAVFAMLLIFTGFAAKNILIRNIFGFGERILRKVPLAGAIYSGMKEISHAFLDQKSTIFKKVVLVEYPRKGIYSLGFITSETQGETQEKTNKRLVNIFIPSTPNPATGMFMFIPQEDIISLDMSVADGIKMVISGGAVVPKVNYGNTENRSDTFKKEGLQGN